MQKEITVNDAIEIWHSDKQFLLNSHICPFYNKCENTFHFNTSFIDTGNSPEIMQTDKLVHVLQENMHTENTECAFWRGENMHSPVKEKSFNRPTFASLYVAEKGNCENYKLAEKHGAYPPFLVVVHKNVKRIMVDNECIIEPNTYWEWKGYSHNKWMGGYTTPHNTPLLVYEVYPKCLTAPTYGDICNAFADKYTKKNASNDCI